MDFDFEAAIETWKAAAVALAEAEGEYARAYAQAIATSQGRNEAARQSEAELATKVQRDQRDRARIEEQAAKWAVQYALARAGREARSS